jgi:hypothetical protein
MSSSASKKNTMSSSCKRKMWGTVKLLCMCLSIVVIFFTANGCSLKKQVVGKQIAVDETATQGNNTWPDLQLKDKFKEYWGYRCEGDADRSFMLEAPYAREMIVPERYSHFIRGSKEKNWTGIKIVKIEWATAQMIQVDFYLKYRDNEKITRDVFFHDSWIIMGNQWSHAYKDPLILPD